MTVLPHALDDVTETVGSEPKARRIYAYSLPDRDRREWVRQVGPEIISGTGHIKVGETTKATARERIKEQLGTAYPDLEGVTILLDETAAGIDGGFIRDHAVHRALEAAGVRRVGGEWFACTLNEVKAAILAVKNGKAFDSTRTESFGMRPEQEEAVARTAGYFRSHAGERRAPHFLWNAKMRFGKTFTTYQLAREMGWTRILVLTFKPAVQAAWRDDLLNHVDFEGWEFIDRTTSQPNPDTPNPLVWFASFQDLIGRTDEGRVKEHNRAIHALDWDCIVLDEYHFGAWRDSVRELYDPSDRVLAEIEEPDEPVDEADLGLSSKHFLYLSGTPFRAIANGEFTEDQVFDWTYLDEQEAKVGWDEADGPNPYVDLPRMEMYTYRMGESAAEYAYDGEFNVFSLNEYFRAKRSGRGKDAACVFDDENRVSEFLEMLRGKLAGQMKQQVMTGRKAPFPYESPRFRNAIRHSVWFLPDVASCLAMAELLRCHAYFSSFEIVVAAGSHAGQGASAKPPVEAAIHRAEHEPMSGSITLTCGKLMTGVTIRQWTSIFMLCSLKSPESYFQAAFRVQSPWSTRRSEGSLEVRKDTCFVFEFDPNRALSLIADYGTRLAAGGATTPGEAIRQLTSHLPIFAFDGSSMAPLDADAVLDWAATGIGAAALARRWNSALLVDVNATNLSRLLDNPDLLAALEQIEDFRSLAHDAEKVVTSTNALKTAKRQQGGQLDNEQRQAQDETRKHRREIRQKLQKFVAKVPVFMYLTDFREEALVHVIQSLDPDLFERVTGLTVNDFKLLNEIGLFNPQHMNHAIYMFKQFERASLHYADRNGETRQDQRIGLWDRSITAGELDAGASPRTPTNT